MMIFGEDKPVQKYQDICDVAYRIDEVYEEAKDDIATIFFYDIYYNFYILNIKDIMEFNLALNYIRNDMLFGDLFWYLGMFIYNPAITKELTKRPIASNKITIVFKMSKDIEYFTYAIDMLLKTENYIFNNKQHFSSLMEFKDDVGKNIMNIIQ